MQNVKVQDQANKKIKHKIRPPLVIFFKNAEKITITGSSANFLVQNQMDRALVECWKKNSYFNALETHSVWNCECFFYLSDLTLFLDQKQLWKTLKLLDQYSRNYIRSKARKIWRSWKMKAKFWSIWILPLSKQRLNWPFLGLYSSWPPQLLSSVKGFRASGPNWDVKLRETF